MKPLIALPMALLASCSTPEPIVRTQIVTVQAPLVKPHLPGCTTANDPKMPAKAPTADMKDGGASERRAVADRNEHRHAIAVLKGSRVECERGIESAFPAEKS